MILNKIIMLNVKNTISSTIENYIQSYDKKYIKYILQYRNEVECLTKTIELFLLDLSKVEIIDLKMNITNFDYWNKNNEQMHYVNFIFIFTVYDGKRFSMSVGFSYKDDEKGVDKYSLLWNDSCHSLNMIKNSIDHWKNLQSYQFLNEIYG